MPKPRLPARSASLRGDLRDLNHAAGRAQRRHLMELLSRAGAGMDKAARCSTSSALLAPLAECFRGLRRSNPASHRNRAVIIRTVLKWLIRGYGNRPVRQSPFPHGSALVDLAIQRAQNVGLAGRRSSFRFAS